MRDIYENNNKLDRRNLGYFTIDLEQLKATEKTFWKTYASFSTSVRHLYYLIKEVLKARKDYWGDTAEDEWTKMEIISQVFLYGYIQGIREERAKKKEKEKTHD